MAKRTTINKSAFVREMGRDMSAAQIVEKARQRGFSISAAYVHTIRSADNRKARGARGASRTVARVPSGKRGNLHAAVDRLAGQFVKDLLGAIRGASLNDVLSV